MKKEARQLGEKSAELRVLESDEDDDEEMNDENSWQGCDDATEKRQELLKAVARLALSEQQREATTRAANREIEQSR